MNPPLIKLLIVEDNEKLRKGLKSGFEATGAVEVPADFGRGEAAWDFRRSGILSHYAYVRKSNYLLPQMILPLLKDAIAGRSFIDAEIEARVQEVRHLDEQDPMALLEPNEQAVAGMLAAGLTNEQIAARMGFRDKRTISRTNGQIYTAWGLNETATDEKVARTRAAIIVLTGRLILWDEGGRAQVMNEAGEWVPWEGR
ncbi:MAG: hypothetical protein P8Y03_00670 [Anaerolineales bacterium]